MSSSPNAGLGTEFARAWFFVLFSSLIRLFLFWCFGCSRFIRAFFDVFSLSHDYRFKAVSSALFWQKTTHISTGGISMAILTRKQGVAISCTFFSPYYASKAPFCFHLNKPYLPQAVPLLVKIPKTVCPHRINTWHAFCKGFTHKTGLANSSTSV